MKKEENENGKQVITISPKELVIGIMVLSILIFIFKIGAFSNNIGSTKDFKQDQADSEYSFNEEQYQKQYDELEERLECFELNLSKLDNGDLGVILTNTSQLPFSSVELNIIFYDGDKKPIAVKTKYIDCILANQKWAELLYDFEVQYETYDYLVTADNYDLSERVNLFNKVSIKKTFDDENNMLVSFQNNGNKKIDSANATAIYYDQNGNIGDIENFYVYDLKPNKVLTEESYKYLNMKEQGVSDVELVLTYVYSYK